MYLLYNNLKIGAWNIVINLDFPFKPSPLAAQMCSIPQVWAWVGLLITLVFMKSLSEWKIYNMCQNLNRLDTWQQKWALPIQVGSNLVRGLILPQKYRTPLWQTIPNKPQRKSDVFIQLCLMTVLLLPAWLSSLHTVPKRELETLLFNVSSVLWIIVLSVFLFSDRRMLFSQTAWIHDIPVGLSDCICMDWTRRHAACGPVCHHPAFSPLNRVCVDLCVGVVV